MKDPIYLYFKHKCEDIGAFAKVSDNPFNDNCSLSVEPQNGFFKYVELSNFTLEVAERKTCEQGYTFNDVSVTIRDENNFFTHIRYSKGKLDGVNTNDSSMIQINPAKAFEFWVDLQEAMFESKEIPKDVKDNLSRGRHISSLDEFYKGIKEKHGSIDEFFSMKHVHDNLGMPEYHPKSLDMLY